MKYSFNPDHYLEANPDAAKALGEGRVVSAWDHFVRIGCREERPGVPDVIRKTVKAVLNASLVTPPADVLSRIQGAPDAGRYEMEGKVMALDVYSAIVPFFEMHRPLRIGDVACGYGRVTRFLKAMSPLSMIRASDIDEGAVAWCRETYCDDVRRGHYSFIVNPEVPPLPYSSGYFDVVCALAFRPMPEKLQLQWLSELRRIIKPERYLVLSMEGDALSKYFAVLKRFPSGVPGCRELALCMKHAHTVI